MPKPRNTKINKSFLRINSNIFNFKNTKKLNKSKEQTDLIYNTIYDLNSIIFYFNVYLHICILYYSNTSKQSIII